MRVLAALLMLTGVAFGDDASSSRTVRIVVPAAAGNGLDIAARIFAAQFEGEIGSHSASKDARNRANGASKDARERAYVVIENRPGAGASLGAVQVIRSAPDGKTLLLASSTVVTTTVTMRNAPYAMDDLYPLAGIAISPFVLITSARHATFDAFLAHARLANALPREVLYGAPGHGSTSHFASLRFAREHALNARMVHYRSSNDALIDVMAGRIDFYFAAPSTIAGQDKLRAFPEAPFTNWYGLFAPAGTPARIAARVNEAASAVVRSADFRQRLAKIGAAPLDLPPAEFRAFLEREAETYRRLAQESGIASGIGSGIGHDPQR